MNITKEKKKNVTLICPSFRFSKTQFYKPAFYIMRYLKEIYDIEPVIVFDEKLNDVKFKTDERVTENSFQGVKLINISDIDDNLTKSETVKAYKTYIEENARDIDLLLVFHANTTEMKLCNFYKKLNPKGKVMTILDFSVARFNSYKSSFWGKLKHFAKMVIYRFDILKFYKTVDVFTVETESGYEYLKKNKWNGINISKKLQILPFGYDKKDFGLNLNEKTQKDNIFLCVGTVGANQKNSEVILKSLKLVDLKDWKFVFVGAIDNNFKDKIEIFNKVCPEKRKSVLFAGAVTDRKVLAEYYKKSKVLVFASRSDSFGLVLVEALAFQDFLVSTPVGVAPDIVKNGIGDLFDDTDSLLVELQMIVDGKIKIDSSEKKQVAEKYDYQNIIENFEFFKTTLM